MGSGPANSYWIETEDWHTAGEPFRIVQKLPTGYIPGSPSVRQRRHDVINTSDHPLDVLRQSLCHEPRGHADMYGGFITPPDDSGAHFGVLFWHKDGFSTACGHGTIALGYWAVANNIVAIPDGDGTVDVVVDVPSGRVVAKMTLAQGKPIHGDFINVPSYQLSKSIPVEVPSQGVEVEVALAFSGAVYATLNAMQLGLTVEPNNVQQFIQLGREIKASLGTRAHYGKYDCYGVIFFDEDPRREDDGRDVIRQRNVTIFADGQVDRSPCGSGTCARLAVLNAQGRLAPGKGTLFHRSIIGSEFRADITSEAPSPSEFPAGVPRVSGQAHLVGRMSFFVDKDDPVYPGFLLR